MGVRGELFSTRFACDGRTYFFNVKENRMGDLFLAIVESKPNETEGFERRSIVVFQNNAEEFIKAFKTSLEAMEKAAPSDKVKPPRTRREGMAPRDDGSFDERKLSEDEKPRHYIDDEKPPLRDSGARRDSGPARRDSGSSRDSGPARRDSGGSRDSGPARRDSSASRDAVRHEGIRKDVAHATGRRDSPSTRDPGSFRDGGSRDSGASRDSAKKTTGRVLRVKPKAGTKMPIPPATPPARPAGKRMTVRKVTRKTDE